MKLQLTIFLLAVGTTQNNAKTLRGNEAKKAQRELQIPAPQKATLPGSEPTGSPPVENVGVSANDNFYRVQQGEELQIDDFENGFLFDDEFTPQGTELFVDSWSPIGSFQGELSRIDSTSDGTFRYRPASGFLGTEAFRYTACLAMLPNTCSSAIVWIDVYGDPNQPDADPIARDDIYILREGETITIIQPGILNNDQIGNPYNPLYVCETNEAGVQQDLDINDSGRFVYTAEGCWTGTETFTYRACYQDYPDMMSNVATVRIQVLQDPSNPGPPSASDDSYTVFEGETLRISANGVLSNDGRGNLYVRDWQTVGFFEGDLNVNDDGSFEYTSVSGMLGVEEFTYTVCNSDWDCLDCRTATARIEVVTHPDKPESPPVPRTNSIEIAEGQLYRGNLKYFVIYDLSHSVVFNGFNTRSGFTGILNHNRDGSFEYGNGPAGSYTFDYQVCYEKWPDLCTWAEMTLTVTGSATQSPNPNPGNSAESSSRRGVATYYEVTWAGKDSSGGCEAIEPKLTLSCHGDGEISLIDMGLPSDNNSCKTDVVTGNIECAAQNSGVVYAECRDGRANTPENRKIISTLYSKAVACGGGTAIPPYHTYHMAGIKTWCGGAWVDRASTCSALPMGRNCYADQSTAASSAQPLFIQMSSLGFDDCIPSGPAAPTTQFVSGLPMLEDKFPSAGPSAFPLQECQGDCDDDDECGAGLVCFQRQGTEAVPGCVEPAGSTAGTFRYTDFCIRPITSGSSSTNRNDNPSVPTIMELVGDANGEEHPFYPLLECQADCDYDDECMGELVCFKRNGNEEVPGCIGDRGEFAGKNFCIRPSPPTINVGIASRMGNPDLP